MQARSATGPATASPLESLSPSDSWSSRPARRNFLLLQGPVGPFFRQLGAALEARGDGVVRVAFHGGDAFDSGLRGVIWYRGSEADWPAYLVRLARRRSITDLVLVGDARPMHRDGINALRIWRADIAIHVFEEGYLRPDWITLERNGVNAWSQLPKDAGAVLARAERCPAERSAHAIGRSVAAMTRHAVLAYLAMLMLRWAFPHYRHHRPHGPLGELGRWLARLPALPWHRHRARRAQQRLQAVGGPIFTVLLQLETDKQISVHSPYRRLREFLSQIVDSFAAHAPDDARLIVKAHPLDCSSQTHRRRLLKLARAAGLEHRVDFLDGGHLPSLLKASVGAITINSTAGMSALYHGVPLLAMGPAIYRIPGLTHQGGLDRFWTSPEAPDPKLYQAFRRLTLEQTQINGSFYTRGGIRMAVATAVERLTRAEPRAIPPTAYAPRRDDESLVAPALVANELA